MKSSLVNEEDVDLIFREIKELVVISRNKVYNYVNVEMLYLYWNIGKIIINIQGGDKRVKYGERILEKLSEKLTGEFGRGFASKNLRRMRKFYLLFSI